MTGFETDWFRNGDARPLPRPVLATGDAQNALMFTSAAEVFRKRQALRDLSEVIRANQSAVERLGTTEDTGRAVAELARQGGRFDLGDGRLYTELLLAAAMPEDDFPCFTAATAILLRHRLEGGAGDDLFWNWEAFRDHYMLADAPVRAALMNGFRTAAAAGRTLLENGPEPPECLTRSPEDVLPGLDREGRTDIARAIRDAVSAEEAGRLWTGHAGRTLSWSELSGFRCLYERPASMAPDAPEAVALIPWS